MWSGQSVGLIHDLPGAGEVVETIVDEARSVLEGLRERVRPQPAGAFTGLLSGTAHRLPPASAL